jgi:two-component system sensor histidine kinase KdpD
MVLAWLLKIDEHVSTVYVFAVFLISLMTEGYLWGILSAAIGTFLVDYAFTVPYFTIDLLSAIVMFSISLLTSALTLQKRYHQNARSEAEKERMRANLLRAVSHDLRTPLTTIYGSSSALLENENTLTPQQQHQMLRGIQEDAQWLIRMVENLLSITRIDSSGVSIIKTPTALDELLDAVLRKFHKLYPRQKVILTIPDQIVMIPMDAILIEQVIVNILENAVQHAEGMTVLKLRVFTLGNKAIFEIKDNGCGINPKRLETLFTGYYTQEYEIADSQKKNAGIGLSVCATIINAIWGGYAQEGSIKKLQVNMANIRRKIGDKPGEGDQNYITNELGVGYRLNE